MDANATGEDLVRCLEAHGAEGSFNVELLLGLTDFVNFVNLMSNFKEEENEKEPEW